MINGATVLVPNCAGCSAHVHVHVVHVHAGSAVGASTVLQHCCPSRLAYLCLAHALQVTLGVNHFATYYLTSLLLPLVGVAQQA
jgi:hypothetical protein